MPPTEDWIAPRGLWPLTDSPAGIGMPDHIMNDRTLSLQAKALFALLLAENGKPVNPYEDAYEEPETIAAAIQELVDAELAVRVEP